MARRVNSRAFMSTDKKNSKAAAHTFFAQLKEGGYTANQVLAIATELIDLVTTDLKEAKPSVVASDAGSEVRASA